MRYVSAMSLKEGMKVGKTIYTANGHVFLKAGIALKQTYIDAIKRQDYPGIYINDAYSEDIEIHDVVDPQLRSETTAQLKCIFNAVLNDKGKGAERALQTTEKVVNELMEEILNNKDVSVNLMDLKSYDDYTFQHSINVSVLGMVIGNFMDLDKNATRKLGLSGSLHDIGKLFVPQEILNKPGKLTSDEFDVIKTHPRHGYDFLKKKFMFPPEVYVTVLQHHEKYNGAGYPDEKDGGSILLSARIIAISDVFDAITSRRSYHAPIPTTEAMEYIMANSGMHFDPEVVKAFLRKVSVYPLGISVKLSNGLMGVVVQNSQEHPLRPVVRIMTKNPKDAYTLDLWEDTDTANITIIEAVG